MSVTSARWRSTVKRFGWGLWFLVILAAGAGACKESSGPREAVLVRLIGSGREAAEILDPRIEFALEPVWQDKLDDPVKGVAGWAFYVPAAAAAPSPGGGLDLGPLGSSQYLVWTG